MNHHASHTAEATAAGDPPANVLLRAPEHAPDPAPCPASDARRLLVVSLDGDANGRLAARRTRQGLPEEVAVLVADETRSAAATATPTGPTTTEGGSQVSWAVVDSPGDLAGIGERIDSCLTSWSDEDGIEVCIDSVSDLLADADLPTVYRFLHVLMRRVDAAGAHAHYHVDEGAHDDQVLSTVGTLFEHVRRYEPATDSWADV